MTVAVELRALYQGGALGLTFMCENLGLHGSVLA